MRSLALSPSDAQQTLEQIVPAATKPIGPILAKSGFELFAEDAAGHPLPVYGRQLFDEGPATFAPIDSMPVPADYVLGPGDELQIRVWGKIDFESRVIVDRNGQVSLPKVGTLAVAGLRYDRLEHFVRNAIGNLYKDFELSVSLGQLRSIQVFALGSARQPGVYTVSSLSTLVNALFASGGPSATGSMRRIQLRRNGRLISELDLYDLLRKGDKSHDVQLLPGDVIYIPPVGPQIAMVANVNEPGIYELKGETTVASAVESAGGLTNLAGLDRILLERVENHRRHHVDEFALDAAGLQRILQDGDLVRIFEVSPRFENAVMIRGNVSVPGRYAWHEGIRIADLIPSREFLVTPEHWNTQNHRADQPQAETNHFEDQPVSSSDPIASALNHGADLSHSETRQLASLARSSPRRFAELMSSQRNDRDQSKVDVMSDIAVTDSEINWDYAVVERLDDHDLSTHLVPFNLGNALDNPASADNQLLKPGDVVTIFSRRDLPLPIEKHASFVRIAGEVNAPGVYRVDPGETLRAVVEHAGGLTPHSYLYASELTRVSTRQIEKEQLKLSVDRMQRDLVSRLASGNEATLQVEAAPQEVSQLSAEHQTQLRAEQEMISQLGNIQPAGRVVLGVEPDAKSVIDIPDLPLEDGDTFYIPPVLSTIQVTGEVYNPSAFRYQSSKRLSTYLRDSGGPMRTADVKRIFLIRADGTVISMQSHRQYWSQGFEHIVLMPGDAIVVPPKRKNAGGFMTQLPLVAQVLSQFALTGAVVSMAH
jgi:protein involved in polysaccharide export with SLBB domain